MTTPLSDVALPLMGVTVTPILPHTQRKRADQLQDCGEAEIIQDSGSETSVIEPFLCAGNIVVGVLLIYGIKQQGRWVLDPPEWATLMYLPAK